jgi:cytochrome P450
VLSESLRVLTPNALMVRVMREPVVLGGYRLPVGCEVWLCPFLSHRDPQWFPEPQRFSPSRWAGLRPSAYAYFPFGAGGHGCVGRALALRMLHTALSALLREGAIVLDGDADVDWRVQVMLMPTVDPMLRMCDASPAQRGMFHGGINDIVELSDERC